MNQNTTPNLSPTAHGSDRLNKQPTNPKTKPASSLPSFKSMTLSRESDTHFTPDVTDTDKDSRINPQDNSWDIYSLTHSHTHTSANIN